MLNMKYKPSQSPQAWHWPLVILRISRVMLSGSVEQAECLLLRDFATVKKRKLSGLDPIQIENFFIKSFFKYFFLMLFFATTSDSTEISKKLLFFWCWLAELRAVTECDFWKKIISTFVDFFRFCQNQQLSANCWLDCWEPIKCTVPDF